VSHVSDFKRDQGVIRDGTPRHAFDVEALVPAITTLREAAQRYARAVAEGAGTIEHDGLALEEAAFRYAAKLDEETRKANAPDYLKIVEQAQAQAQARHCGCGGLGPCPMCQN